MFQTTNQYIYIYTYPHAAQIWVKAPHCFVFLQYTQYVYVCMYIYIYIYIILYHFVLTALHDIKSSCQKSSLEPAIHQGLQNWF